jgi:methylmalonyl-CoA/ethylmalonyl-CoA epimerase
MKATTLGMELAGGDASGLAAGQNAALALHHVGFVVASIAAAAPGFAASIAAAWDHTIIEDPLQCVRVTFIGCQGQLGTPVELVEPAGIDSPVFSFLRRGGGLHHLCYEVADLEKQLRLSQRNGAKLVRPPLPAVAFAGRRIAWVFTKQRLLLEFLEKKIA